MSLAQGTPDARTQTRQYLTFQLAEELYATEILAVQEIRGYSGVTPIPHSPPHIKGVMNLRGAVIPILDLRLRFAMEPLEYNKFNVIIVFSFGEKAFGVIVDAVSDVLDVTAAEVRPPPEFTARSDSRFISGMATVGEKLVVLLDVARLMQEEVATIAA
ncbi:MAG TPA: chemotaxis protein CheW [Polyangiaceae bacterium]|nr:chemotaxis protein CheW [Polyangiaceae bacterium]